MTHRDHPTTKKATPREPRAKAAPSVPKGVIVTHPGRGGATGKGEEKSAKGRGETGAVPTISENPIAEGGSKRGNRKPPAGSPSAQAADATALAAAVEAQAERVTVTLSDSHLRAGWKPVEGDGDPGVGFFRFRMRDLPDVLGGAGGGTSNVIELFAVSLEAAREQIAALVTKKTPIMRRAKTPDPITARPFAHKPTRLSKRQRREMEAAAAAAPQVDG